MKSVVRNFTPMAIVLPFLVLAFIVNSITYAQPFAWPPGEEDSAIARMAPADVMAYIGWASSAKLDPSKNPTEKWVSNEPIQESWGVFRDALASFVNSQDIPEPGKQMLNEGMWKMFKKPGAVWLEDIRVTGNEYEEIRGGMAMRMGEDIGIAVDLLNKFSGELEYEGYKNEGTTNQPVFSMRVPEMPALMLKFGVHDDYFLVAAGQGEWEAMLKRAKNASLPKWLKEVKAKLNVERIGMVATVNVEAIMARLKPFAQEDGFREFNTVNGTLKLDDVKSFSAVSGMDSNGFLQRVHLKYDRETKGLLSILGGGGISENDIRAIPEDVHGLVAFQMSPTRMLKLVELLAEEFGNESEIESAFKSAEEETGIDVKNEVIGNLTGLVYAYGKVNLFNPTSAGLIGIQVKDAARMAGTLGQVAELVEDSFGVEAIMKPSNGYDVYTANTPFGVNVSWCLCEDQVLLAAGRRAITSHLRKLKRTDGNFVNGEPFQEFKKFAADNNLDDLVLLQLTDMGVLYSTYYPLAKTFVPPGDFAPEFPMSMDDFPTPVEFSEGLRPNVSAVFLAPDGLQYLSRRDFPISFEFTTGVAVGMMLPAVQQVRQAARRTQMMNNMRQVGLALHNYEAVQRKLPAAYSVDENGKPLLSWRVHILPYLNEVALYEQFHLDEPWDSPHNRKLIDKMPPTFECPAQILLPGHTTVLAVVGEGSVITSKPVDGKINGESFNEVKDGTSQTVMAVNAETALQVPWTSPQDYQYELSRSYEEDLKGTWIFAGMSLFADGSVQMLDESWLEEKVMKATFNKSDGKTYESFSTNGF